MPKYLIMIGVFDSGFGGLHVLRGITKHLPQYGYIYLGDSKRAPYGDRSPEEVYRFTKAGVDFLFDKGAQLVILACNTASSEALRTLQQAYGEERKVLGVLVPFSEAAAARTKNKRVGVIATEGTVKSKSFVREITKIDPTIRVFQCAAPKLVPLIEAGKHDSPEMGHYLQEYLTPLVSEGIDTLVLGCTHYGIVEPRIRSILGPSVDIVSERDVLPGRIKEYLERHPEVESRIARGVPSRFFSTDPERFAQFSNTFFEQPIFVEKAELKLL